MSVRWRGWPHWIGTPNGPIGRYLAEPGSPGPWQLPPHGRRTFSAARVTGPRAGTPSPMQRHPVGFREFLERIAPLDALPAHDRRLAAAALASGDPVRIERAALDALE